MTRLLLFVAVTAVVVSHAAAIVSLHGWEGVAPWAT